MKFLGLAIHLGDLNGLCKHWEKDQWLKYQYLPLFCSVTLFQIIKNLTKKVNFVTTEDSVFSFYNLNVKIL